MQKLGRKELFISQFQEVGLQLKGIDCEMHSLRGLDEANFLSNGVS